jgi:flagellar hook-basal body complex protein FliE
MTVRIDSVLKNAVNGVQDGLTQARRASGQLAMATGGSSKDTDAVLQLKQSEQQVAANARVIRAADETLGTLVDVKV